MRQSYDATEMMRLSMQTVMMAFEAQMIIAMRLGGMAGFWDVTKSENNLMSTEKLAAAQASSVAAVAAIGIGASPAGIALAAMKPIRRKTTANLRRLGKRGLKIHP